jgi:hypothetical protein
VSSRAPDGARDLRTIDVHGHAGVPCYVRSGLERRRGRSHPAPGALLNRIFLDDFFFLNHGVFDVFLNRLRGRFFAGSGKAGSQQQQSDGRNAQQAAKHESFPSSMEDSEQMTNTPYAKLADFTSSAQAKADSPLAPVPLFITDRLFCQLTKGD